MLCLNPRNVGSLEIDEPAGLMRMRPPIGRGKGPVWELREIVDLCVILDESNRPPNPARPTDILFYEESYSLGIQFAVGAKPLRSPRIFEVKVRRLDPTLVVLSRFSFQHHEITAITGELRLRLAGDRARAAAERAVKAG